MTTHVFSYNLIHGTSLQFNQWVNAFLSGLSAVGMTQTADTGQTTFLGSPLVPIPGTNSTAGYQVWRTNDTHLGSPQIPLYLKFYFGTNSGTTRPRIICDIGTGTDGAGTVTGNTTTGFQVSTNVTPAASQAGPCYFCHTDGYLGIVFGYNGPTPTTNPSMAWATLFLMRSAQADGQVNGNSYTVAATNASTGQTTARETLKGHITVNLTTGVSYGSLTDNTTTSALCWLPGLGGGESTYTDANGNTACFPAFSAAPQPFPLPQMCSVYLQDMPEHSTFTATPIGTTARTYLTLHARVSGSGGHVANVSETLIASSSGIGVLWE